MEKNIYDEEVYLNKDEEALNFFITDYKGKEVVHALEKKLYGETIDAYEKFVNKIVGLLQTLDLNNSIEYSLALSRLIKNGFLSYNLEFESKEPEVEIQRNLGISVVCGEGCCRNISDLHNDVLSKLGMYCKQFYCFTKEGFHSPKEKANHVLCLVKYNDTLHGLDIYNGDSLFYFKSPFVLNEISFYSSMKMFYKPYCEINYEGHSFEEMKEIINNYANQVGRRHLSPLEYHDDISRIVSRYLMRQGDLFMDFHNETKDLKNEINEGMQLKLRRTKSIDKE